MAREQIMAAGGIVLRREQPPRIAVVRLRKRDEWVLPKGKLDDGETPREAARREVLEETGHNVTVHEFLGTLVLDTGVRSKIVHYWRMEASGGQARALMDDVRSVDWLPLDAAVERLSRSHEKTFLETVGPYALAGLIRRTKAKAEEKAAEDEKAASRSAVAKGAGKAAAKPSPPKVAAAKPTTRKRRTPAVEPAEPAAMPTSVEVMPIESAPVVVETITPPPDVAPDLVEMTNAPEHDGVAGIADPDSTEAEAPIGSTFEAETSEEGPAEIASEESPDVARVRAVAEQIKSMTTEAVSRIAIDKEQDEAAQDVATAPGEAPDLTAPEPSMPERRDTTAAHAVDAQDSSEAAPTEPQRQTLAQKVRGWFGSAA